MKKSFFMLFMACFAISITFAQKDINKNWATEINKVFKGLDKAKVPHGILLDYAMEFINVPAYNGSITPKNHTDANIMGNIYKTLLMGKVTADTTYFPRMETFAKNWALTRHSKNLRNQKGTVVLAGLFYNYAHFNPNAKKDNKILIKTGFENPNFSGPKTPYNYYADKYSNGKWQNPYQTAQTIAFAAPIKVHNKRSFNIILPKYLVLSNAINSIKTIQINLNNGKGYQTLAFGKPLAVNYTANGVYNWEFKTTLTNGKVLYSHTKIQINAPTKEQLKHTQVFSANSPNNQNLLNPFTIKGATVTVRYAPAHSGQIRRPFIVAEGFDVGSIVTPEKEGGDTTLYGENNFLDSLDDAGVNLNNLLTGNNRDYDLIYIDWNNGTDMIQHNSETLQAVIEWVNQHKANNGSTEPNVLLGQSMGGLIGRYTLAKMEQAGANHDVRLFIAHDSPMQGANSSLSGQFLINHMYQQYTASPVMYAFGQFVIPTIVNLADYMGKELTEHGMPNIQDALSLNDTPAAMQMNYYYASKQGNVSSVVHDKWQEEFDAVGYPTQCENIAISNGNECAVDNGYAPKAKLLGIHNVQDPNLIGDLLHMLMSKKISQFAASPSLFFLSILPGGSKYIFDFDTYANPAIGSNDRKVYYGRIRYEKKLLWIGPKIKLNLSKRENYAPSNVLPFETYSGGIININNLISSFSDRLSPNAVVNEHVGFIPVTSALDIKRNNGKVIPNDYTLNYAGGSTPDPALSSGFDNFIVDYNDSGIAQTNQPHISFQARNGNWLAEEINGGTGVVFDCSDFCESNQIEGDNIVCDSGTYTLNSTVTPIWTITEGNSLVNTTLNGNNVTLTKANNSSRGFVTLQAVITDNPRGCGTRVLTKRITIIGSPTFYLDRKKADNHVKLELKSNGLTFEEQGITSFSWKKVRDEGGCIAYLSSGQTTARASGDCTNWSMILEVSATNSCGTRSVNYRVEPINYYAIHTRKNSQDHTLLDIQAPNSSNKAITISVFNINGEQLYSKTQHNNTFNIGKLKQGLYIAKITDNDNNLITKKFVIK